MQTEPRQEGWINQHTWAANLAVINDGQTYQRWKQEVGVWTPESCRTWFWKNVKLSRLLPIRTSEIDWKEIAQEWNHQR